MPAPIGIPPGTCFLTSLFQHFRRSDQEHVEVQTAVDARATAE